LAPSADDKIGTMTTPTSLPAPDAGARCLNCNEPFVATPKFCPACGQETDIAPPSLFEMLQHFGGAYLSTEGALWRTLKLLLLKPGELTRQYLAGRRKHYVLPVRLYLTISVICLLLFQWLGSGISKQETAQLAQQLEQVKAHPERPVSPHASQIKGLGILVDDGGGLHCSGLPAWVCERVKTEATASPTDQAQRIAAIPNRINHGWGQVMFVLMPLFALMLKLLYRSRRRFYTEHLVFTLHLHSFWFIAMTLAEIPFWPVKILAQLSIPVYATLAMRRVYGGRWWGLLPRAALLALSYGLLVLATLIIFALGALIF
jgi:hypothetical protein